MKMGNTTVCRIHIKDEDMCETALYYYNEIFSKHLLNHQGSAKSHERAMEFIRELMKHQRLSRSR